jgi:hypothetical protein
MPEFNPIEEKAIEMLDDLQLEAVRVETIACDDERFEFVLWNLCRRGLAVIERVCGACGEARGLSEQEVELAIEDAAARMLIRLSHPDPQPQIRALAAELAAACVARPWPELKSAPRPSPRRSELRLVGELGEAIGSGKIRPNDWENS